MRRQAFVLSRGVSDVRCRAGASGGPVRQDGVGMEMYGAEPRARRAGRRLP